MSNPDPRPPLLEALDPILRPVLWCALAFLAGLVIQPDGYLPAFVVALAIVLMWSV